jgi:hypothetical protein
VVWQTRSDGSGDSRHEGDNEGSVVGVSRGGEGA